MADKSNNSLISTDEIFSIAELKYARFFIGLMEKLEGKSMGLAEFIRNEREYNCQEFQKQVQSYQN